MTTITITRAGKCITAVQADGHTQYGAHGEDIVCAALSSVIQTAMLGLMQVAGVQLVCSRNDDKGQLAFSLPELSQRARHDADMILDTMLLGVLDLHDSYSDYIALQIINNN